MKKLVAWLSLGVLAPLGCTSTQPQLRPPKPSEEFVAPPSDPAFGKPVAYPAESLDQDPMLKKGKGGLPGMMKGGGMGGPGAGLTGLR